MQQRFDVANRAGAADTAKIKISPKHTVAVIAVAGRQYLDDSTAYYKQLNILKLEDLNKLEVAKTHAQIFS